MMLRKCSCCIAQEPILTGTWNSFENQLETIFKVTHSSNFNTSIQALMLIQQISAAKHYSADRFYRTLYESLLDPRLLNSSKQIMYLNLLYRSLKADVSVKRVKAFVKRLLQVISLHEPPFVCGVLYLISELATTFPSIKAMLSTPEEDASDNEEHYRDVPEAGELKPELSKPKRTIYDGRKRDPGHAAADTSCLWELLPLQTHFHPSVHLFASRLLHSEPMAAKPDPTLHTLMHFLDRFVYRNPKSKTGTTHGSSIMQPLAGTSRAADILITNREGGRTAQPVNTEAFWRRKVEEVAADEVFFHAYFMKAGKGKPSKKDKAKKKYDEDESGEEGEDEIWKALVQSRPEIEGESGDEDFSDLDMDDMSNDNEEGEEDVGMDEGVELNLDGDVEDPDATDVDEDATAAASDDGFDLESADEGAFVGSDEEIPADFDDALRANVEGAGEAAKKASKKDRKEEKDSRGKKRRKLKHLPTFASVEDYAKLLEGEDSE